jgi:hypothetical protein
MTADNTLAKVFARETITKELIELARSGHDDVLEAKKAWLSGDLETAFYAVDRAGEDLETREDIDASELCGWLRDEIESLM